MTAGFKLGGRVRAHVVVVAVLATLGAACNAILGNGPAELGDGENASLGDATTGPARDGSVDATAEDRAAPRADAAEASSGDGGCDLANVHSCGSCANDCTRLPFVDTTRVSCVTGRCAYACLTGYDDCADAGLGCTTPLNNAATCGTCKVSCAGSTPLCAATSAGSFGCVGACSTGQTDCSGTCANLTSDATQCGACGNACPSTQICSGGSCVCPSANLPDLCAGACTNVKTDGANCGSCGHACAGGNTCQNGACACPAGTTLCNGSCVDLTSDVANCGGCGAACANLPHVSATGLACHGGKCSYQCASAFGDCADAGAGCPTSLTSMSTCGACNVSCSGTTPVCGETADASPPAACFSGCSGSQTNCAGTCTVLANDPANCGACGKACAATQSCTGGSCVCVLGDTFCTAEGACVNTQISNTDCGACGIKCPSATSCVAGACVCPGTQTLCGSTCTATQTDIAHCGSCTKTCAGPTNGSTGSPSCNTGSCGLACNAATPTNCSGACVNTMTDGNNCGGCGTACATGSVCTAGKCVAQCPGANLQTDPLNCGSCNNKCAAACSNGKCVTAMSLGASPLSNAQCAVMSDGTVRCWGQALGPTAMIQPSPTVVPGLSGATAVSVGADHACAVVSGGAVMCWGQNQFGQLGNGSECTIGVSTCPASDNNPGPTGLAGATAVLAGGQAFREYSCGVASGNAFCWGEDGSGQAFGGGGSGADVLSPSSPVSLNGVASLTDLGNGVCALLTNHSVSCWGEGAEGLVGTPTTGLFPSPTTVAGLGSGVTAFAPATGSAGPTFCALMTGGTVQCFGAGPLGNGTSASATSLTPITGLGSLTVKGLGGGNGSVSSYFCAVLSDNSVRCWGDNSSGQLGLGTVDSTLSNPQLAPTTAVVSLPAASQISTGDSFACALLTSGNVMCWGDNSFGELGIGMTTTNPLPTPQQVKW